MRPGWHHIKYAVKLTVTLMLFSCSSPSAPSGIKLVGNISLVSVASQFDHSYQLVLKSNQRLMPLLAHYVIETYGNDSGLVVKCIGSQGEFHYFKIEHEGGYNPSEALPIRAIDFNRFRDSSKVTYNFTDDVRWNWK